MFRLTVESFLLNLWQVSFEDEKDRQNRLAKMRSLLFRHEMKAKHIKKIKSKTYHRLLKKDRVKGASVQIEMDPDAAKELAMKREFKRAEVIIIYISSCHSVLNNLCPRFNLLNPLFFHVGAHDFEAQK